GNIFFPEVLFRYNPTGHCPREKAKTFTLWEHIRAVITPEKLCNIFTFVIIAKTTKIIQPCPLPSCSIIIFFLLSPREKVIDTVRQKITSIGTKLVVVNGFSVYTSDGIYLMIAKFSVKT